jgi:adenylosuccinate synthase
MDVLTKCQPQYEEHPGWKEDTSGISKFKDLPENARKYLKRLEQLLGTKIDMVSVGSKREQTIKV